MKALRRPDVITGVAALGFYLVVCGLTVRATGHHVRPLFDGVGPAPRYQWVNPPKAFAAGNVVPTPNRRDEVLGPSGSPQDGIASSDGQLVVDLPAGAIPLNGPVAKASVAITPLDPATLGPLPPGEAPDGNAYRVEITTGAPAQPVAVLAKPGTAQLTVPQPTTKVFSSSDGRDWQPVETFPVNNIVVSFRLPAAGYFVASAAPVAVTSTPSSSDTARTVVVAALTALLALLLALSPVVVRRVRRARGSS
jgi:hypothetical protein